MPATPGRRSTTRTKRLTKLVRRAASVTLVATIGVAGVVAFAGATSPQLLKGNVNTFKGVLENAKHRAYYLLSAERSGTLHCTTSCESAWFPFLVGSKMKSVSLGSGVEGKIGFVKRTSSLKQVTYNGYPIYLFSGDRANQSKGEGIKAFGGTWFLVSATARSSATTEVTKPLSGTPTTTKPVTTTTKPATTTTKPVTTTTKPETTTTKPVTTTTKPEPTTTAPAGGGTGF
jgi:predicted lipoprotein with Yx(FWY)xxD motif